MPYVIALHSNPIFANLPQCVGIFTNDAEAYEPSSECLNFLIANVFLNDRSWSLSALARDFRIDSPDIYKSGFALLISDAMSAVRIKYSFFDLFRCIEHEALRSALSNLNSNFLDDPKGTSDALQKNLSSERALYATTLRGHRSVMNGAADVIGALQANNRYLGALLAKETLPEDPFQKSVNVFYAVRNSIAHAKAGDLMMERFDDYQHALEILIPYIEILALRFGGIEMDAPLY